MILTVHDELLFEVPEGEAEEVAAVVRETMQSAAAAERAARPSMWESARTGKKQSREKRLSSGNSRELLIRETARQV